MRRLDEDDAERGMHADPEPETWVITSVGPVRRIDRSYLDLEQYDDVRFIAGPRDDDNPDVARPGEWSGK